MANNLYIASLEPASGKSVIALGVMELLSRRLDRVGYFRPVVPSTDPVDSRLALMDGRYELAGEPEERYAFTVDEVERLLAQGRTDELFKGVLEAYRALADKAPFVLCDGTDYTGVSTALEFEFNAKLANHLGAPVLAIVNGREQILRSDWVKPIITVGQNSLAVFLLSMGLARIAGMVLDIVGRSGFTFALVNLSGMAILVAFAYWCTFLRTQPWRKIAAERDANTLKNSSTTANQASTPRDHRLLGGTAPAE